LRRNFLVPMPRFATFDELNAHLEACCRKRLRERLRRHERYRRPAACYAKLAAIRIWLGVSESTA